MDHLIHDEEIPKHERELTLSTGAILGIFLGLVILCGGFFGFGYNMGRKSAPVPLNLSDVNTDSTLPPTVNSPKPTPGSPLDVTSATPAVTPTPKPVHKPTPPPADTETADTTSESPKPTPTTRTSPPATTPAPIVRQPIPVSPSALSPSVTPGPGTYMVQVAAVSHQEDADLLVGALRGRGYAVSARPNTADNFIHVQIGPFHSKQEADAMRQRLLTDGYNAIVKQ